MAKFTCNFSRHCASGSGHSISLSGLFLTINRPWVPLISNNSRPFCRSCLTMRNSSSVFDSIADWSSELLSWAISVPVGVFSFIFSVTIAACIRPTFMAKNDHILLIILCVLSRSTVHNSSYFCSLIIYLCVLFSFLLFPPHNNLRMGFFLWTGKLFTHFFFLHSKNDASIE